MLPPPPKSETETMAIIGSLSHGAEPDDELRAWLKVITAAMSLS